MNPQAIVLGIYAASQIIELISRQLAQQHGVTEAEMKAAWEAQKVQFQGALDLWNKKA